MAIPMKLRIYAHGHCKIEVDLSAALELGRQREGEPGPYTLFPGTDHTPARVIIAPTSEQTLSRKHLSLEPLSSESVRMINLSRRPVWPTDGIVQEIGPGSTEELSPPFALALRDWATRRCFRFD
jgi:hypothetical protein